MTNRFSTFRIDSSSRRGRVKKICVITKAIFVHLSDHYRHLFIIYHFKISCEDCIARLTLGGDGAGSKKWFHDGGREAAAAASLTHWPFIWCHHLTNQKYAKPWICVHYTPIQGFAYCAQCAGILTIQFSNLQDLLLLLFRPTWNTQPPDLPTWPMYLIDLHTWQCRQQPTCTCTTSRPGILTWPTHLTLQLG